MEKLGPAALASNIQSGAPAARTKSRRHETRFPKSNWKTDGNNLGFMRVRGPPENRTVNP